MDLLSPTLCLVYAAFHVHEGSQRLTDRCFVRGLSRNTLALTGAEQIATLCLRKS